MGLPGPVRVERNRQIHTAAYSIQPSPIGQVPNETPGPIQIEIQRFGCIVSGERLSEGAVQPLDISTILGGESAC